MDNIFAILTALGISGIIGGIIGAYFQYSFQQRLHVHQKEHELKERRYFCILILMLTKMKPEIGLSKVKMLRPDLKSKKDIEDELQTELLNEFIFADDKVLEALVAFIKSPDYNSFVLAAMSMRKDLWGKKTKVKEDILKDIV